MRYPFIVYTRHGLPAWAAGRAFGPLVIIDPAERSDGGLVAHEVEHVKQWALWLVRVSAIALAVLWGGPTNIVEWFLSGASVPLALGGHHIAFALVPEYRLGAEVAAYRAQARCYADDRLPIFAKFISERYLLRITPAAALQLLREG